MKRTRLSYWQKVDGIFWLLVLGLIGSLTALAYL